MIAFAFGFAVGVIAGPWILANVWPRIRAWWDAIGAQHDDDNHD